MTDAAGGDAPSAVSDIDAPIRIVISYRREDAAGHAGHLYADLENRFGEDRVFIDIDNIEPGMDFTEVIANAIEACDVFIAVIGQKWLNATDKKGHRKLDSEDDFVRFELEAAMARELRIVPLLVQGAEMPLAEDLPPSLAAFARRNALEISDKRWRADVSDLCALLAEIGRDKARRTAQTAAGALDMADRSTVNGAGDLRYQALRELALREQALREKALREEALRDEAFRKQSLREEAFRDEARREDALREQAKREQAERETAERETAERETAERETAERERVEGEQHQREKAPDDRAVADGPAPAAAPVLPPHQGAADRPHPSRRSRRPAAAVAAVAVALVSVAGVTAASRNTTTRPTPATTIAMATNVSPTTSGPTPSAPQPAASLPSAGADIPAGSYRSDIFWPSVGLKFEDGWRNDLDGAAGLMQFSRPDSPLSTVAFIQLDRVYDPKRTYDTEAAYEDPTARQSLPGDVVDWLCQHPRLTDCHKTTERWRDQDLDRVDISVRDGYPSPACEAYGGRCVLAFFNGSADSQVTFQYALVEGLRYRFLLRRSGSYQVLVAVEAPAATFDGFLDGASRLLRTLSIDP